MAVITTLVKGSELLNDFTTLTFVEVLFAKGFSGLTNSKLVATFLPSLNIIRFRLDETTNDMISYPNSESFVTISTANGSTATVYSKTGAIIILKINTSIASYGTMLTTATTNTTLEATETLIFSQNTNAAVTNYNGYVNRDHGVSIFDKSYIAAFNKRMIFDANIKGVIVFAVNGFDSSKTWVSQTKDAGTGDIYLAFSCAPTNDPSGFGFPVKVAQNIGTLGSPTYVLPTTAYTNMPELRYAYSTGNYFVTTGSTSPYPYLIATNADGSSKVSFTIDVSALIKTYVGVTQVDYDMGSHYLGLFKSATNGIYGIGGAISTDLLGGSLLANPMPNITGVRVIDMGGIASTDIKIKQRSATINNQVVLSGSFPALDTINKVYLSVSENNPLNNPSLYGAEVDITESGTYILKTIVGGFVTVTTNRLFYNPYYNGYNALALNTVDSDLFNTVTPSKVINGDTEYKCFYIKNRHPTKSFSKVTLWSDYNCNYFVSSTNNPQYMQMAANNSSVRNGDGTGNPVLVGGSTTYSYSTSTSEQISARLASANLLGFVPDTQDYIYNPPNTVIPDSVDLRTYTGAVEDQLTLNSCTANVVVSACEMYLQANNQFVDLSRRFNYYVTREADSLLATDGGAYLRTAIAAAKQVGLPTEATWPYTVTEYNTAPSAGAYSEAATRTLDRYELISATSGSPTQIQQICSALSEGFPVAIGMHITNAFLTIAGDFTYQQANPYTGSTPSSPSIPLGHAVVIVGYSNAARAFIIENSWGSVWGYQGYMLFPFDAMHDVFEAWVLRGFDTLTIPSQMPVVVPTPTGATPPSGITFDFHDAELNGIVINNLAPQESVPIWVKRVVNPSNTVVREDMLSYLRMKVVY